MTKHPWYRNARNARLAVGGAFVVAAFSTFSLVKIVDAQFSSPTCVPPTCSPTVIQNTPSASAPQTANINVSGTLNAGGNVGFGGTATSKFHVFAPAAAPTTNIVQVSNLNDSARYFSVSSTSTNAGNGRVVLPPVAGAPLANGPFTIENKVDEQNGGNSALYISAAGTPRIFLGSAANPAFSLNFSHVNNIESFPNQLNPAGDFTIYTAFGNNIYLRHSPNNNSSILPAVGSDDLNNMGFFRFKSNQNNVAGAQAVVIDTTLNRTQGNILDVKNAGVSQLTVSATGGVAAAKFFGDGSGLTGVSTSGLGAGTYGNVYNFSNASNSYSGSGANLSGVCLSGGGGCPAGSGGWTRTGTNVALTNIGDSVGVGTASPTYKLDVNGPTSSNGANIHTTGDVMLGLNSTLFFDNNYSYASGNYIRSYTPNVLTLNTAGAERMRVDAAGNVGIGVVGPTIKLDVNGAMGTTGGFAYMPLTANAFTTYNAGVFSWTSNNNAYTGTVDTGLSRGGAAAKVYVGNGASGDSSGTLVAGAMGIGTTTPQANSLTIGTYAAGIASPLDVQVNGGGVGFVVSNSATEYTDFASGGVLKGMRGHGVVPFTIQNDGDIYFAPQAAEVMRLKNTGVGIGTNAPGAYKLNVNGDTNVSGMLSSGATTLSLTGTQNGIYGVAASTSVGNLLTLQTFNAGTFTNRFTVGPTGNVTTPGTVTATSFSGSGASLTGVAASTLATGTYSNIYTFNNASNSFTGNGAGLTGVISGGLAAGTYSNIYTFNNSSNSYSGNGAGLTGVTASSASGLTAGTYSNIYTFNNASNSFTGNGANLTSLNASNISSGTLAWARIANAACSGGQYLTSVSGGIWTCGAPGGGIGGGGTANTMPLWTGGATLGNSIITQPTTNGIVVNGTTAGNTANIITNGDIMMGTGAALFFDNVYSYNGANGNYIRSLASPNQQSYVTGGVERMRVNNNGVGVGTTPVSGNGMTVVGSNNGVNATGFLGVLGITNNGGGGGIGVEGMSSYAGVYGFGNGAGSMGVLAEGAADGIQASGNTHAVYATGGTYSFYGAGGTLYNSADIDAPNNVWGTNVAGSNVGAPASNWTYCTTNGGSWSYCVCPSGAFIGQIAFQGGNTAAIACYNL